MKKRRVFFVLLFLITAFPADAHAYLDPASGSYIIQIVIAALVGGLFIIKQYFQNIKLLVKRLFSKADNEQPK